MGTDPVDAAGTVTNTRSFKVHKLMCTDLSKLVDRVLRVFPEIEAARPRCSSGIQALCLLNKAIEKAKMILQYCSESSKLYLALTGDVILSRCKKTKSLLEQSLCQIQDMVPVMLAAEISQIVDDLLVATFLLDPYEEAVGKVVRELLQKDSSASDSAETSHVKSFQLATSMLQITSPKTILIEKRAIKMLLDKVSENDPTKKKILTFFLYLFKKYGSVITVDQAETVPGSFQGSFYGQSAEAEPRSRRSGQFETDNNMLRRPVPPEEFRCPISSRLMFDPVVVTSGQTYERIWIQKWFDEGNATCPKTGMKLTHYSLTPNVGMKDLISKWSAQNGVVIPDPSVQAETQRSWDTSCTSIASFGSSMNDLYLPMDFSAVSIGSIDSSFGSDYLRTKAVDGFVSVQNDCSSDNFRAYGNIPENDLEYLSKLGELAWESKCKAVEDVKNTLMCNDKACYSLSAANFVEPLVTFLREASGLNDINAQRDGLHLLSTFASKNRNGIPNLREDAFDLIASLIDSEVTKELFAVIKILSGHAYCRPKIASSGALVPILRALDSQIRDLREQALNILHNLSSDHDLCSQIVSFDCVPKLVPLIRNEDSTLNCLFVMKNLCNTEDGRASLAETRGCIASITEVLDIGSPEEQEHAIDILLLLCSQRVEYCQLVMEEGIVPPLVTLSVNGNDRAKVSALELLRQLRDIRNEPERPVVDLDAARASSYHHAQEKKPSKSSGFFGRKVSVFGKKR